MPLTSCLFPIPVRLSLCAHAVTRATIKNEQAPLGGTYFFARTRSERRLGGSSSSLSELLLSIGSLAPEALSRLSPASSTSPLVLLLLLLLLLSSGSRYARTIIFSRLSTVTSYTEDYQPSCKM
jgi:hypothetical protein